VRLPGGDLPARLSDRLHALDYTVEGVRRLLGPVAADALDREEVVPALRQLSEDDSPLATVVRLLLVGDRVEASATFAALGVDSGELLDLVEVADGQVQASVELAPYAADDLDWYVASDWSSRRTGQVTAVDHVLGVGGASTMLAQCTVRPEIGRALDLGTGCGVQAFHLARHAEAVVGTDISERCLQLAALNAAMNGVPLDLRRGGLFDPIADERFDLVVSNPPFVIGSPAAARHDYRDSGMEGDGVSAAVVRGVIDHLTDGGWCQLLANWEITDGGDWAAEPRQWVHDSGLDAWVIQRDVQDPAAYVETWLRDAGEHQSGGYRTLYDTWLATLERRGVLGVGFGLITLRRSGADAPTQRFQHAPQEWHQPVADDVQRWFAVQDALAQNPAGILLQPLQLGPDVVVEEHRALGQSPGDLEAVVVLRRSTGMAWSGPVDTFGLELLAALDGVRPAGEAVITVASAHGVDPEAALGSSVPVLARLAEEGFVR
jgi:methylase of polypeptide subunit release factors